nr:unnamed protein product [Spirometra erinaceieuropaei]
MLKESGDIANQTSAFEDMENYAVLTGTSHDKHFSVHNFKPFNKTVFSCLRRVPNGPIFRSLTGSRNKKIIYECEMLPRQSALLPQTIIVRGSADLTGIQLLQTA